MNIPSMIGVILSAAVLFIGLKLSSDDIGIFLDYPSLFIVLGGTFAATSVSFQITKIILLVKIFVRHIFTSSKTNYAKLVEEIMKISDAFRKGESLDGHIGKAKDPFLKEALTMVNDGFLEPDHLIRILKDRAENVNYLHTEDANKIKVVGKFPPAFGMMGTTIGMVVLLANLGGADALLTIGPAMGVCLITTLYGVVVANLAVIPISENLTEMAKSNYVKNLIIIEGIKQLLQKANPVIVAEELNSFLPPGERLDWKNIIK